MTTDYKVTELFCIIDEFCKHFDAENAENLLEDNSGVKRRRRQASLSDSEIIAQFPLLGLTRALHPLDNVHTERTIKQTGGNVEHFLLFVLFLFILS